MENRPSSVPSFLAPLCHQFLEEWLSAELSGSIWSSRRFGHCCLPHKFVNKWCSDVSRIEQNITENQFQTICGAGRGAHQGVVVRLFEDGAGHLPTSQAFRTSSCLGVICRTVCHKRRSCTKGGLCITLGSFRPVVLFAWLPDS